MEFIIKKCQQFIKCTDGEEVYIEVLANSEAVKYYAPSQNFVFGKIKMQ